MKKKGLPGYIYSAGEPFLQQLTDINTKIRINAHPDITLKGKDNRGKFGGILIVEMNSCTFFDRVNDPIFTDAGI